MERLVGGLLVLLGAVAVLLSPLRETHFLILAYIALGALLVYSGLTMIRLASVAEARASISDPDAAASPFNMKEWAMLVEVDSEIAGFAREARALGTGYERCLARKFLALNEKQFLPHLMHKLRKDFEREQTELAEPSQPDDGRNIDYMYRVGAHFAAVMKNGEAIAWAGGKYLIFKSIADYRAFMNDYDETYIPADDEISRAAFTAAARKALRRFNEEFAR